MKLHENGCGKNQNMQHCSIFKDFETELIKQIAIQPTLLEEACQSTCSLQLDTPCGPLDIRPTFLENKIEKME